MRDENPMARGLMAAMGLGLVTFMVGFVNVYEMRSLAPQPASATHSAGAGLPPTAPRSNVADVPPERAENTDMYQDVPPVRTWQECDYSRLERYYSKELAAEQASYEAFRSTRVLPTLFVPCCPKAGTTFINQCVSRAFHPAVVCRDADPASWSGPGCAGKSFILGGVRANAMGLFNEVKEPFYFNKETAAARDVPGAARDLAALAGPPLPLCTWWLQRFGAPLYSPTKARSSGPRAGRDFWNRIAARARLPCRVNATPPPAGTPPRQLATNYQPAGAWPGCWLGSAGKDTNRNDFTDTVMFKVAFPLRAELPPQARTYDMTPNYLCSGHALRLMRERYGPALSAKARFIVMLRDPVSRAFSEFSMFRTWGWEKVQDFGQAVSAEIRQLRQCLRNDTLLLRPRVLAAMEPSAVVRDAMRCGSGDARQYIRNSLYETCIAGAYAYFARSQFMFVFAEDLREMSGAELVLKIEAFTGLTLVKDASGAPSASLVGRCDTGAQSGGGRKALPNHQTKGRIRPEIKASLRRFFAPSRAVLAQLIKGTFQDEQPLARLAAFARDDPQGPVAEERDVSAFGLDMGTTPWRTPAPGRLAARG